MISSSMPVAAAVALGLTAGSAFAGGTLRVAMTASDVPTTTGAPDNGYEGLRFLGYPVFEGLVLWDLKSADKLDIKDDAGLRFGDELARIGYAGNAPLGNHPLDCYLELHIEQAPHLDREGCDIGIVVGGYKTLALHVDIEGETGHSGGTPMVERRNALVGAGYLIAAVNDIASLTRRSRDAPRRRASNASPIYPASSPSMSG